MKTKHKKQIFRYGLLTVTAFCLVFLLAFISLGSKVVHAEESPDVEVIYVHDVIDAKDYTLFHNGQSVIAEGMTVVFPSGGVYGGDSFEIKQAGKYKFTYFATVDGERIEEVKHYLAIRRAKDVISTEAGMEVGYGDYFVESPYEMKSHISGTVVAFKSGQEISFTTKVKTEKLTRYYNILEMIVMPSVFNETDFERLTVTITDADNVDNYVEIVIDSSNTVDGNGQVSYVRTGANGQVIGGYEGSTYHTQNYGTSVEHSFRGKGNINGNRSNITISENLLTVSIDNESRKVYCGPFSSTSVENLMVNDLDDPLHYKSNPWQGFTSDEVTVKVKAGKFVKGVGKVVFTQFGDFDLSRDIIDETAPEIEVDYDWSQPTPVAEVGKDFPIFAFEANDALDDTLKTNVWVYYINGNGKKITVNHDGEKFFAKYQGTYQLVYRAEDYSGNVNERKIEIEAMASAPSIEISVGDTYLESEVYQEVHIPLSSNISVSGGSGELTVERRVVSPSDESLDVGERLLLTELGDYQVIYTVTDYLGNQEECCLTIRVVGIQAPKFVTEPTYENTLIKGFIYDVSSALVIETVGNDVVEIPCQVYVNGSLVEDSFVADGGQLKIRYVAEGSTGTAEWQRTLAVVDTEGGKYRSKYFHTQGDVRLVDEKAYLQFDVNADGSAEFLNTLSSNSFSVTFSIEENGINFSSMHFILKNAQDKNLTVTVKFTYDIILKQWYIQLGNDAPVKFTISKDVFTLKIVDGNKLVDAGGEPVVTIYNFDNGEIFNGFSNELYFGIEFVGVVDASYVRLTQICNQAMGYSKSSIDKATDDIKPIIELDDVFIVRQKLGSNAQIPTARAYDVLSQISELTVSVVDKNGTTLVSGPANQTFTFNLSNAGYYTVTYVAKDTNGNTAKIPYGILVNDETTPTLNVQNNLKSQYKVGDKIYIPSYSVTDNGEQWFAQVMLILPNNEMRLLEYNETGSITSFLGKEDPLYNSEFKTGDGGFIVNQAGSYVLRILAYDEYYNYVVFEFEFEVK